MWVSYVTGTPKIHKLAPLFMELPVYSLTFYSLNGLYCEGPQGCESSDFNLISDCFALLKTPHFQTFNAF